MRTVRERGQGDFLFVPALVSLLRHRGLKAPARDVLVGYGEEVVPALAHFLRDPEEDIWVRRHVPSTLSRIPCQASMDVLVAELVGEKDAFLRYKCVAAIDRLHHEHPELTFDPKPIETLAWLEGMQFYLFLSYFDNLFVRGGITTPCLLKSLLEEKRARARDRVFFMLALIYPRRDVMAARWEIEHGDGRAKASAVEYLDNVLSGPLRRRLMPMLEDLSDEERVTRGNVLLRTRPRDVEETLLILINSDDEVVSAAAIDLVGRLELRTLADDLDHVLAHRDVRDWHVFEAASWTLAGLRLQASKRRALWLEPLPSVEIASRLRALPIFASVATDELFRMARTGRQVRLDRGHTLYEAGSPAAHVYLLLDGQVQSLTPGGQARDIGHPAPIGLEDMLEARPHPDTMRASDSSVALQLSFEEAIGLLSDNTDLVQGLFRWMLDHPAFGTGRVVLRGTVAVPREGGSIIDTGPPPDAAHPGGALRPIDVVLALRRIPVFARSSVQARVALAAIAHEERLEPDVRARPRRRRAGDPRRHRRRARGAAARRRTGRRAAHDLPGRRRRRARDVRGRAPRRQPPRDHAGPRAPHQPRGLLRPARPAGRPAAVAVRDTVRRATRRVGSRGRRHAARAGGGAGVIRRPAAAAGVVLVAAAIAATGTLLSAHELFLRPRGFFVAPGATITLPVFNGTFTASENAIAARADHRPLAARSGRAGRDRANDLDGPRAAQHGPRRLRRPGHLRRRRRARRASDHARRAGLRPLSHRGAASRRSSLGGAPPGGSARAPASRTPRRPRR